MPRLKSKRTAKKKLMEDPVLSSFLSFLSIDMLNTPQQIRPLDSSLMARVAELVKGVDTTDDEKLRDEAPIC